LISTSTTCRLMMNSWSRVYCIQPRSPPSTILAFDTSMNLTDASACVLRLSLNHQQYDRQLFASLMAQASSVSHILSQIRSSLPTTTTAFLYLTPYPHLGTFDNVPPDPTARQLPHHDSCCTNDETGYVSNTQSLV